MAILAILMSVVLVAILSAHPNDPEQSFPHVGSSTGMSFTAVKQDDPTCQYEEGLARLVYTIVPGRPVKHMTIDNKKTLVTSFTLAFCEHPKKGDQLIYAAWADAYDDYRKDGFVEDSPEASHRILTGLVRRHTGVNQSFMTSATEEPDNSP